MFGAHFGMHTVFGSKAAALLNVLRQRRDFIHLFD